MYEYRLFIIKDENVKLYQQNPKVLFNVLKVLFMQKENLNLGYSLYRQLCVPFSVKLLSNYFSDKIPATKIRNHIYQILSFYERTRVSIQPSHILIKTNQPYPKILKIFHVYEKNIFVADFKNNLFFWLNDEIRKHFF